MLFYYGNRKATDIDSTTETCIVNPDVYGKQVLHPDSKYKEISRRVEDVKTLTEKSITRPVNTMNKSYFYDRAQTIRSTHLSQHRYSIQGQYETRWSYWAGWLLLYIKFYWKAATPICYCP